MSEPTEPQGAATPAAPTPTTPAPTTPAPSAQATAQPSGKTKPSKALLIAAIVFGLIGISGVSFTAGYWVSEAGGHRGGHEMHHRGPGGPGFGPGGQGHDRLRGDGMGPERIKPTGSAPTQSTSAPAPTP